MGGDCQQGCGPCPCSLQASCHSTNTRVPFQTLGYSTTEAKHKTDPLLRSLHPSGKDRNKQQSQEQCLGEEYEWNAGRVDQGRGMPRHHQAGRVRNVPAHPSCHPTTQGFSQMVPALWFAIKERENHHVLGEEGTRQKKLYAMLN